MDVRIFELLHQKDVLLMAKCTGMFGPTFFARGLVIKIEEFYNYTLSYLYLSCRFKPLCRTNLEAFPWMFLANSTGQRCNLTTDILHRLPSKLFFPTGAMTIFHK
jgi:hypothetical protein